MPDKKTVILPRWFARRSLEVAPDLIGKLLLYKSSDGMMRMGRVVETEAYSEVDPASHTFVGPTRRNRAMFGPAGHIYLYQSYGIHWCLNVVTGGSGFGEGVLLRALEVSAELTSARAASGPGKLTRFLGLAPEICRTLYGRSFSPETGLWFCDDGQSRAPLVQTRRVGITKGAHEPWRWYWAGHPAVSRK